MTRRVGTGTAAATGCADGGSVSVEVTVLAPVLLVLLALVVGLGRVADAQQHLADAAADAARAASVARSPNAATRAATTAGLASLAGAGVSCAHPSVSSDVTHDRPGGLVRVRVSCVAALSDIAVPGLPGQVRLTRVATAPVDAGIAVQP